MRRKDKLANMKRVNMLFESRSNENYGHFDVMDDEELKGVYGDEDDSKDVNEAPMFGGQNVSQDQHDELQYDKQNLEKASMDAFATPEGYTTNAEVGETYDTLEGDAVKVLGIDDRGNLQVYLQFGEQSIAWYEKHGMPAPKPFKISWSPKQFDAIVGEIDDYDDSQYHGEMHGY